MPCGLFWCFLGASSCFNNQQLGSRVVPTHVKIITLGLEKVKASWCYSQHVKKKKLTWFLNRLHVSYLVSMCNDGHPVQKHCCYFSKRAHEQLGAKPFAAGSPPIGTRISIVRHCLHICQHIYSTKFFIFNNQSKIILLEHYFQTSRH